MTNYTPLVNSSDTSIAGSGGKRGDLRTNITNSTKHQQCKRFLILLLCISLGSYLIIDLNIKSKFSELKGHYFDFSSKPATPSVRNSIFSNKAYFVDTEGCKMPRFNVIDEKIAQFMEKESPIVCGKPLTIMKDNRIIVNMNETEIREMYNITNLEEIQCHYQHLSRKTDSKNSIDKEEVRFNLFKGIEFSAEFLKVTCKTKNKNETFYKDYHFSIPESSSSTLKNQSPSGTAEEQNLNKLSVMVIGIDSVSRLNFLRQMNMTAALIRENFSAMEFFGFNKVGDNTYPNLVPVLSGLDENELSLVCLQQNKSERYYDDCPFIWKRFKDVNFKTVYAEDVASLGLFNYLRKGFQQKPTDYYLRPLVLEMEKNIASKKKGNVHLCLGGRTPVSLLFDYIKKLIPQFVRNDFFSFFWSASVTHDFLNMPPLIDDEVAELLITLNNTNVLNRTILFLMSDHGLRWGSYRRTYQGMMEERQPFVYILLPNWFAVQYPTAVANLRQNANRLTTPFDLHATFSDLIDLSTINPTEIRRRSLELLEMDTLPRGISLFVPIPTVRTCEAASIASHWCTCHEKQDIPTNDARVQRAARFIVKSINDKLKPHPQCRVLFLNSIVEANVASANQNITKEVKNDILIDITVRLQTKPGLGEFEATVRIAETGNTITGTISRTNLYGKQSYCIDNYLLKMYCYCER